jgi:hypothetical protein
VETTEAPVVVLADQDEPMMVHIVCRICCPRNEIGIEAHCGEKLLGIEPEDDDKVCDECERIRSLAIEIHGPLPCGHFLTGGSE